MKTIINFTKVILWWMLIVQIICVLLMLASALHTIEISIPFLTYIFHERNIANHLMVLTQSITHTLLIMFLFHKLNTWNKEVNLNVHLNRVSMSSFIVAFIYGIVYFFASRLLLGYYGITFEFLVYIAFAVMGWTILNHINPNVFEKESIVKEWFIDFVTTEE